jgi:hypothetical protein
MTPDAASAMKQGKQSLEMKFSFAVFVRQDPNSEYSLKNNFPENFLLKIVDKSLLI